MKDIVKINKDINEGLFLLSSSQPAFTCSNLTKETLEQGVKYVQS